MAIVQSKRPLFEHQSIKKITQERAHEVEVLLSLSLSHSAIFLQPPSPETEQTQEKWKLEIAQRLQLFPRFSRSISSPPSVCNSHFSRKKKNPTAPGTDTQRGTRRSHHQLSVITPLVQPFSVIPLLCLSSFSSLSLSLSGEKIFLFRTLTPLKYKQGKWFPSSKKFRRLRCRQSTLQSRVNAD